MNLRQVDVWLRKHGNFSYRCLYAFRDRLTHLNLSSKLKMSMIYYVDVDQETDEEDESMDYQSSDDDYVDIDGSIHGNLEELSKYIGEFTKLENSHLREYAISCIFDYEKILQRCSMNLKILELSFHQDYARSASITLHLLLCNLHNISLHVVLRKSSMSKN
jgi:hypothetical protein